MQDNPINYLRKFFYLLRIFNLYIYIMLAMVTIVLDINQMKATTYFRNLVVNVGFGISGVTGTGIINFKNIMSNINDYFVLKEKNIKLQSEIKILEDYYLKTQNVVEENKQLRKLMNLLPDISPNYRTVKVLGDTFSIFSTTLIITGGSESTVRKGQVAINELGLVGRVIDVYDNVSRLMLLSDLNSRVPVITQQSRERAIVTGSGNNKLLKLLYLPEDSNAKVGEPIVTSGDGMLYPAGIIVGTVSEIRNKEYIVTPTVDFGRLDYVILVERMVAD